MIDPSLAVRIACIVSSTLYDTMCDVRDSLCLGLDLASASARYVRTNRILLIYSKVYMCIMLVYDNA